MMNNDKGKQRAIAHDNDDNDQDRDEEPSSPRSFAHLAALSARLYDFCKQEQGNQPTEHDLAYLQATLDIYQSASYLIEPHLAALTDGPLRAFRTALESSPSSDPTLFARYLYWLSKVVTPKQLVRYFSHSTSDLKLLLSLIASPSFNQSAWETRYIVLLWLSLVVSIPFALDRFGAHAAQSIEDSVKKWLGCPGKEHEAAATLAARFYARKDISDDQLLAFLDWAEAELQAPEAVSISTAGSRTFLAAGLLQFLCTFVKSSTRQSLSSRLFGRLYNLSALFQLENTDIDVKSPLIRRLVAKYHGRLAAACLPPFKGSQHGRRSTTRPTALMGKLVADEATSSQGSEDYDVPEEVEVLVGDLLEMFSDPDSRVRWTVSKALARISAQLPLSYIDQIVSALLAMYPLNILHANTDKEDLSLVSSSTWHGATLCLASFLRNTLLSPDQVQNTLPWIMRALTFSQRKGAQKIGSSIRDASCYFVWCAARASSKQAGLLREADVQAIARKLVIVACTDEEVSVRRAASAAFQECVGRLSNVPHGLEALVMMDAFIVGIRRSAFLEAAPNVAKFPVYREALVGHLQRVILRHAEIQMRQLAAQSLGRTLAGSEEDLASAADTAMQGSSTLAQAAQVHGQLLLLTEVARRASDTQLRDRIFASIGQLPQALLSGSAVVLLLPAVADLITASLTRTDGSLRIADIDHRLTWKRFIEVAQKRPEATSHDAAAQIIAAISANFDVLPDLKATLRTLKIGTSFITQQCVTRMLGAFDYSTSSTCGELLDIVVDRLSKLLDPNNNPTFKTIEAKRNAMDSLGRICTKHRQDPKMNVLLVRKALIAGMNDYTFDERGDIGSIVRMACMKRLTDVSLVPDSPLEDRKDDELFHLLLKASVERMDNVREVAGCQLVRLRAAGRTSLPPLPEDCRSLSSMLTYVLELLPTLQIPQVPLSGLVLVAGSPPEILETVGQTIVLDWLRGSSNPNRTDFSEKLLALVETPHTPNRILIPALHLLALLLERGLHGTARVQRFLHVAQSSINSSKVGSRVSAAERVVKAAEALSV